MIFTRNFNFTKPYKLVIYRPIGQRLITTILLGLLCSARAVSRTRLVIHERGWGYVANQPRPLLKGWGWPAVTIYRDGVIPINRHRLFLLALAIDRSSSEGRRDRSHFFVLIIIAANYLELTSWKEVLLSGATSVKEL